MLNNQHTLNNKNIYSCYEFTFIIFSHSKASIDEIKCAIKFATVFIGYSQKTSTYQVWTDKFEIQALKLIYQHSQFILGPISSSRRRFVFFLRPDRAKLLLYERLTLCYESLMSNYNKSYINYYGP